MSDDIHIASLAGLTVGEPACPDDAVILGESDTDANDRENRSLTEYAQEDD